MCKNMEAQIYMLSKGIFTMISLFLFLSFILQQDEHFAIKEKKGGKPLEWEDYKTMRFTRAVSIIIYFILKNKYYFIFINKILTQNFSL